MNAKNIMASAWRWLAREWSAGKDIAESASGVDGSKFWGNDGRVSTVYSSYGWLPRLILVLCGVILAYAVVDNLAGNQEDALTAWTNLFIITVIAGVVESRDAAMAGCRLLNDRYQELKKATEGKDNLKQQE